MLPVYYESRKEKPPVACGVEMGVEKLRDGIFAGGWEHRDGEVLFTRFFFFSFKYCVCFFPRDF